MLDDKKRLANAYIIKKLQDLNARLLRLSGKLNYKGESVF